MTAIAALTLADGQATPVNHTFSPVNIDNAGIAKWADRSGGIALGFPITTFSLRAPTKSVRSYKLVGKVVTPVLEVTSPSTSTGIQPAPTKAYDLIFNFDMTLPERSTLAERKNAIAYVKNYLANTVITNAVESFESVY
jgi:hypothetical protein